MHLLHICCPSDVDQDNLISQLIKFGYIVLPADNVKYTKSDPGNTSYLISLQLSKPTGSTSVSIYEDLSQILHKIAAKVYSITISAFSYDSLWTGANFKTVEEHNSKELN